jgi:hypothetical protein
MRRTMLASVALVAILAGPSFAQTQAPGSAQRGETGDAGARSTTQERVRTERPSREERTERSGEQRSGSERAETGRGSRDDSDANQTQRAQSRPDGQERRAAEQRDERSGSRSERQAEQGRPDSSSGRAEQPTGRATGAQQRSTETNSGERNQGRDAAAQGDGATDTNRSATGKDTTRQPATAAQPTTQSGERAATAPSGQKNAASTAPATNANQPAGTAASTPTAATSSREARAGSQETRIDITPERRERVSEIITRESRERQRVDFSISIGTSVPRHVRLRQIPIEIVEFAPRYRGYEYFVAEDEFVIVEPGSNRIVTTISRDGRVQGGGDAGGTSVASTEGAGGAQSASADATGSPALCRINDAGGGGQGGNSGLAVAVRSHDGRSTDMISLPSGRISVAVDPSGACTITVER